jgi:hypothetical protein
MRYRDMTATSYGQQPQMRCFEGCEGVYSAERGDYFWADPDSEVTCSECGGSMELGREVTTWVTA